MVGLYIWILEKRNEEDYMGKMNELHRIESMLKRADIHYKYDPEKMEYIFTGITENEQKKITSDLKAIGIVNVRFE